MSLEKIVQRAMENNPLKVKEEFESEIATRIQAALEEKYAKMMSDEELTEEELVESEDEEEDESEDEVEDEEDDEKEMDEKTPCF